MTDLASFALGTGLVNVSLGEGNEFRGIRCISIGNNQMSRGNHKIMIGDRISLPSFYSEEAREKYIKIHEDVFETWKVMEADGDVPKGYCEKADLAIRMLLMIVRSVGLTPAPQQAASAPTPAQEEQKGPVIEEVGEPSSMRVASKE